MGCDWTMRQGLDETTRHSADDGFKPLYRPSPAEALGPEQHRSEALDLVPFPCSPVSEIVQPKSSSVRRRMCYSSQHPCRHPHRRSGLSGLLLFAIQRSRPSFHVSRAAPVCQAQRSVLLLLFKWEPKGPGSPQCASCLTFPSPGLILRLSQYDIQLPGTAVATTPYLDMSPFVRHCAACSSNSGLHTRTHRTGQDSSLIRPDLETRLRIP
ncbi:hypothetical protein GGI42DRAFT_64953 [Trichoderma sp. SZMC 28013]